MRSAAVASYLLKNINGFLVQNSTYNLVQHSTFDIERVRRVRLKNNRNKSQKRIKAKHFSKVK